LWTSETIIILDIKSIESAITDKTRAILFVDLYGQTPDIDALVALAKKHNLFLIEDAAQSFGSSYKNKRVGSLADLTCFSFNPVKNLGAVGDAGMVTGRKSLLIELKCIEIMVDPADINTTKWDTTCG
jgi:dTDP-4-amino-4,6-dideoxygalactose transaminase